MIRMNQSMLIQANARIFNRLYMDPALVDEWGIAVRRRIYSLARAAQPGSPYMDPPDIKDRWDKGRFWVYYSGERHGRIRNRRGEHKVKGSAAKSETITIFGISPNAGRVRGADAPDRQYREHAPYTAFFDGHYHRMHRSQVVSDSIGIDYKQPYYAGSPMEPDGFFSVDGKIFGRSELVGTFFGLNIYSIDSYADWLVKAHSNDIEKIIYEEGIAIMNKNLISL